MHMCKNARWNSRLFGLSKYHVRLHRVTPRLQKRTLEGCLNSTLCAHVYSMMQTATCTLKSANMTKKAHFTCRSRGRRVGVHLWTYDIFMSQNAKLPHFFACSARDFGAWSTHTKPSHTRVISHHFWSTHTSLFSCLFGQLSIQTYNRVNLSNIQPFFTEKLL